ncbi:MAG: Rieske (2Fe-2S) protein [Myxococcales bacterium]|nr:Rieske (2Fe-2S) protein [Myxococcales bacterium]
MTAKKPGGIDRREALALCGGAIGALTVIGCGGKIEGLTDVPAEGGALRLSFAEHPALKDPGGSAIVRADGKGKPILVRNDNGEYLALSLKCTHLGCTVRVDDEAGDLACPCHGSRFTVTGEPTKGPADSPLSRYATQVEGDAVVVSLA